MSPIDPEDFFPEDRKEYKRKRKLKQKLDRSQFKKSDQKPREKKESSLDLLRARVLSIQGEAILVDCLGEEFFCSLRGLLKKKRGELKNLLAVGDFVLFSKKELVIEEIEERRSFLSRQDMVRKKMQILAVNIDQVLITASIVEPTLKPSLVDRYLIAAKKGNMKGLILLNKMDLLPQASEEEKFIYEEFVRTFCSLGYPLFCVSTKTHEGIDKLIAVMKDKASVFAGQSGVGKTSLINFIEKKDLKTLCLTKKSRKGSHATTKAMLIPLKNGGFCIDTPGIRSFGLWKLEKQEIVDHFFEMIPFAKKCRFPDCTHRSEPDCKVRKAVEEKKISFLRFESYLSLMESMEHPMEERS
jgi:ribosome biogenesis GTPase / thiamine phosphate phosphatase